MDYAGAVSTDRGRYFRFITDPDGKPESCPETVTVTGWLKVDRWYEVDACAEHAGQLRKPRSHAVRVSGAEIGWGRG
jgi:hypothetical protein